jgi:cyclopropane fatty-acyl-phospholipid synthase-like methyltransferase
MSKFDQERIAGYYDRLVDQHGYDPRACDASSSKGLELRYKVLSEVADLNDKSVLEVGCGLGGLAEFLLKKFPSVQYEGIDISTRMVEEARKCHPHLSFRQQNVLDLDAAAQFDVVLAQGIFYLLGDQAEAKMQTLIKKMFSLSKEAMAFCAISSWSPTKAGNEFYVDPVRLLDWSRGLTTRTVLRHDYLPNDAALYLYRNQQL